jgi:hypothetical protein
VNFRKKQYLLPWTFREAGIKTIPGFAWPFYMERQRDEESGSGYQAGVLGGF